MCKNSRVPILWDIEMPFNNRKNPKFTKPDGVILQFFNINCEFVPLMLIKSLIGIRTLRTVTLVNNSLICKPFYSGIASLSSGNCGVIVILIAKTIALDT